MPEPDGSTDVTDQHEQSEQRPTVWWRRRWVAGVAGGVAVATAAVFAVRAFDEGAAAEPPAPPMPSVATVSEPGAAPVCGFPVADKITSDGVDPADLDGRRDVVDDVATMADGTVLSLRVRDGVAYVLEWDRSSAYRVTRYDTATGDVEGTTDFELRLDEGNEAFSPEQFEVDADGGIYFLDTLMQRRDLVRFEPDGTRSWTTRLPEGDQTEGGVLDLYGMGLWDDVDGKTVIGVHETGSMLHLVDSTGKIVGQRDDFPGQVLGQLPDGGLVLESSGKSDAGATDDLAVQGLDGDQELRLGATANGKWAFGKPSQYWFDSVVGVAPAPDGDGLVVIEDGLGFEHVGADGVRRGVWPDARADLDADFTLLDGSPLVLADGAYYAFTTSEGAVALTAVTQDRMAYQLGAPVKYNAVNDGFLSVMGAGAGLVTDEVYNYFPPGAKPAVRLSLDDSWGRWADRYELRFQVRGDPRVPDPVVGEEQTADIPADGGDVPVTLPAARPGVYEVDAALVERESGDPVSGTCLRYTVGAPAAPLDLAGLADGADWGGASVLRGVQLADQLGVGSYRWQLDFGAIVPDPTAAPSADALVWDSLPSAGMPEPEEGDDTETDPFAELAAAAALADSTGVVLTLQLGSGGEAERAAVDAGTWEGWSREIVAAVSARAPGIVAWQPWNEPNNTGFDDGAAYEEQIGAPFAAGARAALPGVQIVGGNTLGIVPDWWAALVEAGGCASMDAVGVHPYTGLNRSWEEQGFSREGDDLDALREALAPCGDLPIWDTESGWWSDGVANFWAGGSDVARKLLWYGAEGFDEWTYFFSEGGFGESGNSWSLIQYGAYVKPAGAAFAATSALLDGYGAPTFVETGVPGVFSATAEGPGGEPLLAVWSDDLSTTVRLTATGGPGTVRRVDQYGAETSLDVGTDGVDLPVTGAPVFLLGTPGQALAVEAVEPFGPDVLAGRPVTATSTHVEADAQVVTSGTFDVRDPWRSGRLAGDEVDESPSVTVTTDGPQTIDRIAVATAGIRCCSMGLRDYTVSVQLPDGTWQDVADQQDQFTDRVALFTFDPVEVTAVRVSAPMTTERGVPVLSANYSGVVGGLHPSFLPLATESDYVMTVSAIQAWGPGGP
ncbi:galactose-binding domain-containing protein [Oerskovia turbata]